MMGIVESKTISATDCSFLNDRSEFDYASKLFLDELAQPGNPARVPGHQFHEIADSLDQEYADLIAVVNDAIGQRFLDTYVASFCESGDC